MHCPDATELAAFYAALTGGAVTFASAGWAVVNGANGRIDFQTVAGFGPPSWPDGDPAVQLHLDFYVADLAEGERHAVACRARRFPDQPNAAHCLVFRDPVGHPFCLTTWDDTGAADG